MTIGFSNGNFYQKFSDEYERFTDKYLNLCKTGGANALEIHCLDEAMVDYILAEITLDLSHFSYISFHAPALPYKDDEDSNGFLHKLELLAAKYKIQNFVFHPDTVLDWNVFKKYGGMRISIENMDGHKNFGRTVDDIRSILEKFDFSLTLDLQHCFMNDKSMKLSEEFQKTFKTRMVEYHISGFDEELLHYPLFKTKQETIISSLKFPELPIIIESTFEQIGEQERELEYIKAHLPALM